ncbi:hypothetical protein AVEN_245873-1 [Araneus ventricosus]|uniref:Uncharacterized protein n=1 Tax=Araneus ventricosus TaxID=182803 RepID=A0A4Y2HLQ4_ARAVE|nr:hypothetical protein AVEN_245873-1 [Araneus ventricosus]
MSSDCQTTQQNKVHPPEFIAQHKTTARSIKLLEIRAISVSRVFMIAHLLGILSSVGLKTEQVTKFITCGRLVIPVRPIWDLFVEENSVITPSVPQGTCEKRAWPSTGSSPLPFRIPKVIPPKDLLLHTWISMSFSSQNT